MEELTHEKVESEIAKLMAETRKLNLEIKWYPHAAFISLYAATVATIGGIIGGVIVKFWH
jgi:hypothetical protein